MAIKIRKSIYDLDPITELPAFLNALNLVKTSGRWNDFVRMHLIAMSRRTLLPGETTDDTLRNHAHRGPAFLPWHRVFLLELEKALEVVAPALNLGLPYWPWEVDEPLADPTTATIFSDDYLGQPSGCLTPPNPTFICNVSGVANAWIPLRQRFETIGATNNLVMVELLDADGDPVLDEDGEVIMVPVPVLDGDGDPTFLDAGNTGDFFGQFGLPVFSRLLRFLGNNGSLPSQAQIDSVLQYAVYDRAPWDESINGTPATGSFRNRLEGWALEPGDAPDSYLHNIVHVFIGGDMGPGTSPNDPVFFLHHCNVDRLWAKWQERRTLENGTSYDSDYLPVTGGPTGHNLNDNMFPWDGDPKFPAIAKMWSPAQTLDYLDTMDFIYDDIPRVTLQEENIVFGSVIDGETTYRAATFDVVAAYQVRFEVLGAAPGVTGFSRPPTEPNPKVVTPTAPDYDASAQVWFSFEGGGGTGAPTELDIRAELVKPGSGVIWQHTFTVRLSASTIARPNVATVLVLDQSNSMNFDAGNGNLRIDVLRFSAPPFVELLDTGNGIGIVAFDHDPHERMDVEPMPGARVTAEGHITGHTPNPLGNTSIADGIELAQQKIDDVMADYDDHAIVVLTDGHETAPKLLANLDASVVQSKLFAIGLGTADHIQPERLADIAGSNDGYMLLTGELAADGTDEFLLTKYYLQILAGVTNMNVSLDPEGWVGIGQVVREPFIISSADIQADVILLTTIPGIQMLLESPSGDIIHPSAFIPEVQVIKGQTMMTYRMKLPVTLGTDTSHQGTWHAILRIDPKALQSWFKEKLKEAKLDNPKFKDGIKEYPEYLLELRRIIEEIQKHGLKYSLNVHTWSNLKMQANLYQNSYEPGAQYTLRAIITEYGRTISSGAKVIAEITRPDGSAFKINLDEVEQGIFETKGEMNFSGIWKIRILAKGYSSDNDLFTREQLLTGHVRRGGDQPSPTELPNEKGEKWCKLVSCLLKNKHIGELLEKYEIDTEELLKCIDCYSGRIMSSKNQEEGIIKLIEVLKRPEFNQLIKNLKVE